MICYVITIMRVSMEYLYLWHSISRQAQLIVSYIGSIWFQIKKCIFPCKSEGDFLILTEECLTFKAISFCRAPRLRSFLHTFVRPDHVHDGEGAQRLRSFFCPVSSGAVRILQGRAPDRCLWRVPVLLFSTLLFFLSVMWMIFDPLDICQLLVLRL